ncbi:MAG: hypothetical protein AAB719_00980 [Patescibacteria group bacterium]
MSKKIIFGLITLLTLAIFGVLVGLSGSKSDEQVFCTQEAKLCPDGSYVGRTGPRCEFAECPSVGGGGAGILPYQSGIGGTILRGPMCPVMRVGEECPDAPYETDVVVRRASSEKTFATMKSGKDGKFLINLPPGDYIVNAVNNGISKTCGDVSVTVSPDRVENIVISCDTGIR